ncbi:hypothetical protein SLA2020_381110 [Shorea laevis]
MKIASMLPANNVHLFQTRQSSFKCQMSPLNPLTRSSSSLSQLPKRPETSTEITRLHLANLEKLLQTSAPVDRQPVLKDVSNGSMEIKGKGPLEGLNLAMARLMWPEMKAAEEMSPRHLNRLQRLLSKTGEYSPRNNLGSKWREYHGSNHWKGLLDPLDRISGERWSGTASLSKPPTMPSIPILPCRLRSLPSRVTWRCRIGRTQSPRASMRRRPLGCRSGSTRWRRILAG